jgi:hypothetical protein
MIVTEPETPDNTQVVVVQNLFDPDDQRRYLAITAHIRNGNTAYNTWAGHIGSWQRLLPERVVAGAPAKEMLEEEIIRYQNESGERRDMCLHLIVRAVLDGIDQMFRG